MSAWLFRTSQAPHYYQGMTDSLVFTLVPATLIVCAWIYITFANKRSSKAEEGGARSNGLVHRFRA